IGGYPVRSTQIHRGQVALHELDPRLLGVNEHAIAVEHGSGEGPHIHRPPAWARGRRMEGSPATSARTRVPAGMSRASADDRDAAHVALPLPRRPSQTMVRSPVYVCRVTSSMPSSDGSTDRSSGRMKTISSPLSSAGRAW